MKFKDVVSLLTAFGFVAVPNSKTNGSHRHYKKEGQMDLVTVPEPHNTDVVIPSTLANIVRDSGLRAEFNAVKCGVPVKKVIKQAKKSGGVPAANKAAYK